MYCNASSLTHAMELSNYTCQQLGSCCEPKVVLAHKMSADFSIMLAHLQHANDGAICHVLYFLTKINFSAVTLVIHSEVKGAQGK